MPKPLSGSILTRRLADDTLVVDVKIRTERRMLGPASEWSQVRARKLLETRLLPAAQLRQDWTALIPGAGTGGANGEAAGTLTVREAATDYVEALGRYENPNTVSAYRSPVVKHLLPFLAYMDDERTVDRALAEVDEALMLRFVSTKQAERAVLQDIAETLAELDRHVRSDPSCSSSNSTPRSGACSFAMGSEAAITWSSTRRPEGSISLSSRGLSNNEINRCLARMRDIVRMANRRYKLGIDDPTQGCSLPRSDPSREWLHPVQLQALLDAAQMLDANPAQEAYAQHGRYSAVLVLGLLGPRVSEFCAAPLARPLSAGTLYPRGEDERRAQAPGAASHRPRRARCAPRRARPGPGDYIWASAAGTKRDRNNVRNRLLAPVLELGAQLLAGRGQRPLPARVDAEGNPTGVRVTPHMFRRTAMTYWAWADRNQRWAMGQAGHKSAKMTLEAYQQTFPRDPEARAQVVAWLRGAGEGPD